MSTSCALSKCHVTIRVHLLLEWYSIAGKMSMCVHFCLLVILPKVKLTCMFAFYLICYTGHRNAPCMLGNTINNNLDMLYWTVPKPLYMPPPCNNAVSYEGTLGYQLHSPGQSNVHSGRHYKQELSTLSTCTTKNSHASSMHLYWVS